MKVLCLFLCMMSFSLEALPYKMTYSTPCRHEGYSFNGKKINDSGQILASIDLYHFYGNEEGGAVIIDPKTGISVKFLDEQRHVKFLNNNGEILGSFSFCGENYPFIYKKNFYGRPFVCYLNLFRSCYNKFGVYDESMFYIPYALKSTDDFDEEADATEDEQELTIDDSLTRYAWDANCPLPAEPIAFSDDGCVIGHYKIDGKEKVFSWFKGLTYEIETNIIKDLGICDIYHIKSLRVTDFCGRGVVGYFCGYKKKGVGKFKKLNYMPFVWIWDGNENRSTILPIIGASEQRLSKMKSNKNGVIVIPNKRETDIWTYSKLEKKYEKTSIENFSFVAINDNNVMVGKGLDQHSNTEYPAVWQDGIVINLEEHLDILFLDKRYPLEVIDISNKGKILCSFRKKIDSFEDEDEDDSFYLGIIEEEIIEKMDEEEIDDDAMSITL
ncbi:MAG: hypothetical protein H0X51_05215 [Parachlamydiaceae bacterium]|nr:hypothetical protein [Parachlamydiaceae bacterium]